MLLLPRRPSDEERSRRFRSRSPRASSLSGAPSLDAREALLADFARLFWEAPDAAPPAPPWAGRRAEHVKRFRERLVCQAESAAALDSDDEGLADKLVGSCGSNPSKDNVVRWQRFTFFEDLARMSDVLFRGPVDPRHADDIDFRLHGAWRRLRSATPGLEEFAASLAACTADYRVSAVRVAMMLETERPPHAQLLDGGFMLPDARTLASLLSLRCEKDDVEELLEMYRLVCQRLEGCACAWCSKIFDESSSAGLFDGADALVFPATVPKIFVPQCGHAIHTLCFGSQIVPDRASGPRGLCRCCGLPYAWTLIDVDPMVNAFCLLFGPYVDRRAQEMAAVGEVSHAAVVGIAEACQCFAMELGGLLSAASAWTLLSKRHDFAEPEVVELLGASVLRLLAPPELEVEASLAGRRLLLQSGTTVIGPEDRPDDGCGDGCNVEGSVCSGISEEEAEHRRHLTEVFLADSDSDPDPEPSPEFPQQDSPSPVDSPLPPPILEDGDDRGGSAFWSHFAS
mmetsp:Transcript_58288/g.190067  ORF Transcript_58288/g.190067 Transcript_58288/m.190067 type:complete len:513 (+) Transcript_58288:84-1622(+)